MLSATFSSFKVEDQLQKIFNETNIAKSEEDFLRNHYSNRGRSYHGLYHIAHMHHLNNMLKEA